MLIRKANPDDFTQMLPIFRQVIEGGDTYDFEETATDQDAFDYWFGKGVSSFVMEEDGQALGFYKIIPNHRGRGNHVANASFMVSSKARGKGVGRKMGFKAIQFNYVISTNTAAMHLWESLGFRELCRLPGAFNHKTLGFVDAVIFFREV